MLYVGRMVGMNGGHTVGEGGRMVMEGGRIVRGKRLYGVEREVIREGTECIRWMQMWSYCWSGVLC